MGLKGAPFFLSGQWAYEELGGGIRRQVMTYDDHLMMVKVLFDEGAIGYVHSHEHRQISYVVSGAFEVTIDGVKSVLRKGDSFLVAPELPHGVLCVEAGVLIDVFTPARQDFVSYD